eukprot:scaffold115_cov304-Prasinococcus_capsulatus_cf.AAC.32
MGPGRHHACGIQLAAGRSTNHPGCDAAAIDRVSRTRSRWRHEAALAGFRCTMRCAHETGSGSRIACAVSGIGARASSSLFVEHMRLVSLLSMMSPSFASAGYRRDR